MVCTKWLANCYVDNLVVLVPMPREPKYVGTHIHFWTNGRKKYLKVLHEFSFFIRVRRGSRELIFCSNSSYWPRKRAKIIHHFCQMTFVRWFCSVLSPIKLLSHLGYTHFFAFLLLVFDYNLHSPTIICPTCSPIRVAVNQGKNELLARTHKSRSQKPSANKAAA